MADWLKKANEVLGDLAGQAGRQAEILQLQAKLGSLDNDLERVYVEAGKRAEELLKTRQIYDDELRVILDRARVINDEMMELRQKVQDLRQTPERPESEDPAPPPPPTVSPPPTPVSPTPPDTASEEVAGEKACPHCGGQVGAQMVFCPHCGRKLGE